MMRTVSDDTNTSLAPETENCFRRLRIAKGWTVERAAGLLDIGEHELRAYESEEVVAPDAVKRLWR